MKEIIEHIANKLFDLYIINSSVYGQQHADGNYYPVREPISPVIIDHMLIHKNSLMAYQELQNYRETFIKWICIDFDIEKKALENQKYKFEDLLVKVKESADSVTAFLKQKKIPFLFEFSGNRGFHIWITFEENITKSQGHAVITAILDNFEFNDLTHIDKYPQTKTTSIRSKGIGKGVKIPLSFHTKSSRYSFFINDKDAGICYDIWQSDFTKDFLMNQLKILNENITISLSVINSILNISCLETEKANNNLLYSTKIETEAHLLLDEIIAELKKCNKLKPILTNYQEGLPEKERQIIVGLLGRITSSTNPNLGQQLLFEFFSRLPNFRPELTKKKLANLKHYYPIKCSFFNNCEACKINKIESPLELITNINITPFNTSELFNIKDKMISQLIDSQIKYSLENDEVPLYFQNIEFQKFNLLEVYGIVSKVFNHEFPKLKQCFVFDRKEENSRIRTLINLDTTDKIASTYFTYLLYLFFYTELSDNSYGYKFAHSLNNNNIFYHWFRQWQIYSIKIESIIYSSQQIYDDYYVIKADIKKFYESINLEKLSIKLYEEAPTNVQERIQSLKPNEKTWYKNIIKYFYTSSKEIQNHQGIDGLPQGPAYARFLAELYLLGLDNVIESSLLKSREFYFRFVDDIFIFCKIKDNAEKLLDNITNWLSMNDLSLNESKTIFETVREFREKKRLKKYKDNSKYFINTVEYNYNIASYKEIKTAFDKHIDLVNNVKFGLKDNLRFFYYHFKNSNKLVRTKKLILDKIIFSTTGRGSMYKLFYDDLLKTDENEFINISKKIDKLKGLSLTHYLNTLLKSYDEGKRENAK